MFEKMAEQYLMVLDMRYESIKKEDVELYDFAFSLPVDREKHLAHQWLLDHFEQVVEKGYRGEKVPSLVGQFICQLMGRPELIPYAV